MSARLRMGTLVVVGAAATWACLGDVDYTGKACPCPNGYLCDDAVKQCVSDQVDCSHRGCELFATTDQATCLAADDTTVYFATGSTLFAQGASATSATTLATLTGNVTSCSLGSDNVYVATDAPRGHAIRRTDGSVAFKTGPLPALVELTGDDQSARWRMVWAQAEVLFACDAPNADGGSCVCTGCNGNVPTTADGGIVRLVSGSQHITLDDRNVYFVGPQNDFVTAVSRIAPSAASVIGNDVADMIATGGGVVAWADTAHQTIGVAADGGTIAIAANLGGLINDLRVSGGWIFWLASNTISRVPVGGGPSEVVVGGLSAATRMAVTSDWVYWLDGSSAAAGGAIYRHALR